MILRFRYVQQFLEFFKLRVDLFFGTILTDPNVIIINFMLMHIYILDIYILYLKERIRNHY